MASGGGGGLGGLRAKFEQQQQKQQDSYPEQQRPVKKTLQHQLSAEKLEGTRTSYGTRSAGTSPKSNSSSRHGSSSNESPKNKKLTKRLDAALSSATSHPHSPLTPPSLKARPSPPSKAKTNSPEISNKENGIVSRNSEAAQSALASVLQGKTSTNANTTTNTAAAATTSDDGVLPRKSAGDFARSNVEKKASGGFGVGMSPRKLAGNADRKNLEKRISGGGEVIGKKPVPPPVKPGQKNNKSPARVRSMDVTPLLPPQKDKRFSSSIENSYSDDEYATKREPQQKPYQQHQQQKQKHDDTKRRHRNDSSTSESESELKLDPSRGQAVCTLPKKKAGQRQMPPSPQRQKRQLLMSRSDENLAIHQEPSQESNDEVFVGGKSSSSKYKYRPRPPPPPPGGGSGFLGVASKESQKARSTTDLNVVASNDSSSPNFLQHKLKPVNKPELPGPKPQVKRVKPLLPSGPKPGSTAAAKPTKTTTSKPSPGNRAPPPVPPPKMTTENKSKNPSEVSNGMPPSNKARGAKPPPPAKSPNVMHLKDSHFSCQIRGKSTSPPTEGVTSKPRSNSSYSSSSECDLDATLTKSQSLDLTVKSHDQSHEEDLESTMTTSSSNEWFLVEKNSPSSSPKPVKETSPSLKKKSLPAIPRAGGNSNNTPSPIPQSNGSIPNSHSADSLERDVTVSNNNTSAASKVSSLRGKFLGPQLSSLSAGGGRSSSSEEEVRVLGKAAQGTGSKPGTPSSPLIRVSPSSFSRNLPGTIP